MNLALLGFGVVGSGVYEWCRDREDLHVTRVLVRSPKPAVADISTTDFNDIVTDPAIDLVAEVMAVNIPDGKTQVAALRVFNLLKEQKGEQANEAEL